jgi:4-amino-4-deoxychorismate lyase
MNTALGSWIDGVPGAALPADDRGLQYGDGVFETVLVRSGRARFLDAHLARLSQGCTRLGISIASLPVLRAEIDAAVAMSPPLAILKVIMTRGSAQRRGYAPQGDETPRRIVSLWHAPPHDAALVDGVTLRIAAIRLGENPALAGIKHLNRLENVLAAAESTGQGVFDSLLLDASGNLVSGTMCNVFIARAGGVATPIIQRCGVAGVMRGIVLRECAVLGLAASEESLTLDDLFFAAGVFVTNARIGVVPVRRVGEHLYDMNNLANRLAAHIESLDA